MGPTQGQQQQRRQRRQGQRQRQRKPHLGSSSWSHRILCQPGQDQRRGPDEPYAITLAILLCRPTSKPLGPTRHARPAHAFASHLSYSPATAKQHSISIPSTPTPRSTSIPSFDIYTTRSPTRQRHRSPPLSSRRWTSKGAYPTTAYSQAVAVVHRPHSQHALTTLRHTSLSVSFSLRTRTLCIII